MPSPACVVTTKSSVEYVTPSGEQVRDSSTPATILKGVLGDGVPKEDDGGPCAKEATGLPGGTGGR